jgi:hypothetical protein
MIIPIRNFGLALQTWRKAIGVLLRAVSDRVSAFDSCQTARLFLYQFAAEVTIVFLTADR